MRKGKRIKRIVGALLAVIMVFAFMPAQMTTRATETKVVHYGDYEFTVFDDGGGVGSIKLSGYTGNSTEIILPTSFVAEEDGKPYNSYADGGKWAFSVGENVFTGNTTLKKIAIPDGYDAFYQNAFAGCTSLVEASIGSADIFIGSNAFSGCEYLKTYYINAVGISVEQSGIGLDAGGQPYDSVTVYVIKESKTDNSFKEFNKKNDGGNQITIKYDSNPYSMSTVKPETPTDSGDDSGSGSGSGDDAGTGSDDSSSGDGSGSGSGKDTSTGKESGTGSTAKAREKQKGKDGTYLGKGAADKAAEKFLTGYKSENDPKGTLFSGLQLKASKFTTSSITITWKKVKGAKSYVIYGNRCGKTNKYVKQATVKKGTKYTVKKVNKKKLAKGKYYKFIVVALDKNNNVLSTSKTVHATTKGGKNTNSTSVTTAAKKNKVTLKVKKTFKLAAKEVVPKGKKASIHRKVMYESTNTKIAAVNKKGVITAKKKGTCFVYAYAQNGMFKKIKVTVKK